MVCGSSANRLMSPPIRSPQMAELFASHDRDAAERAMQAMRETREIDIAAIERAYAGGEPVAAG